VARRSSKDPEARVPLDRERVLLAALRLADERDIDSLTMRELGPPLGYDDSADSDFGLGLILDGLQRVRDAGGHP